MAVSLPPRPVSSYGPRPTRASARARKVRVVLVGLALLCLAAAFGPTWLVRVAVVSAVLAGVGAVWFAARQLSAERRTGAEELRATRREHRDAFTAERRSNGEVVDELARRIRRSERRIGERDRRLGDLQAVATDLEAERHRLSAALSGRDETIAGLTGQVADGRREAGRLAQTVARLEEELALELSRLSDDDQDAEVHGLPRRRTAAVSADAEHASAS